MAHKALSWESGLITTSLHLLSLFPSLCPRHIGSLTCPWAGKAYTPPLGVFLLLILLFWALSPQIASLPILHLLQFFAQKTPPGGPCYACALYLSQHPCTPFSKLIFSTMLSPTDILYLFTYTFFCLLTHQLVLNYKPCQDRELIYLENLSCSCCIPHLKEFLPHNSHSVFV